MSKSRVVTEAETPARHTLVQETDVRTALTRGLAEYVGGLEWVAPGGRSLRFSAVLDTWASAERDAEYPSAAVIAPSPGRYDASSFTPHGPEAVEGKALVSTSEFILDIQLGVWANDSKQRMGLVAMLERDMCPVDFMYGLLIELPHYFNARALYEPLASMYEDSSEDAVRRYRKAVVTLRGTVPVMRVVGYPEAKPAARVETAERGIVDPSGVVVAAGRGQVFVGHPDP